MRENKIEKLEFYLSGNNGLGKSRYVVPRLLALTSMVYGTYEKISLVTSLRREYIGAIKLAMVTRIQRYPMWSPSCIVKGFYGFAESSKNGLLFSRTFWGIFSLAVEGPTRHG